MKDNSNNMINTKDIGVVKERMKQDTLCLCHLLPFGTCKGITKEEYDLYKIFEDSLERYVKKQKLESQP